MTQRSDTPDMRPGKYLTKEICDAYIQYHLRHLLLADNESDEYKETRHERIAVLQYRKEHIKKHGPYKWESYRLIRPPHHETPI